MSFLEFFGLIIVDTFYVVYILKAIIVFCKTHGEGLFCNEQTKYKEADKKWLFVFSSNLIVQMIFSSKITTIIPFQIIGITFMLCGIVLLYISVSDMGLYWRLGFPNIRGKLITQGIYSKCRNPETFAFFCFYIGGMLFFFNIAIVIVSTISIFVLNDVVNMEEEYLFEMYGKDYAKYYNRVPRYFI